MNHDQHTIHSNPGKVFDCACLVRIESDGETIAFRFPQIEQAEDNMSPMVYVCMDGTELTVRLCDRNEAEWGFAWCEDESRWLLRDSPTRAQAGGGQ